MSAQNMDSQLAPQFEAKNLDAVVSWLIANNFDNLVEKFIGTWLCVCAVA